MSLPHFTARAAVGVASVVLALAGTRVAIATPGFPGAPHRWLERLARRLLADLRTGGRTVVGWVVFGAVAVTVTVLHFVGIRTGLYTAIWWWDLVTHSLGGIGVAGLAYLAHRDRETAAASVWWVVPSVFAIGSGFEVYEFLFKSFWHDLTLRAYAVDTAVDLAVNTTGATLVAGVVSVLGSPTDEEGSVDSTEPGESVDA